MKTQIETDYSKFILPRWNRGINSGHVRKLKRSMAKMGFLSEFPIVVKKEHGGLIVTDGQHRLQAAKELGLPVHYGISENDVDPASIPASKSWSTEDYVNRHAQSGIAEYIEIIEFSKKYGITVSNAVAVLTGDMNKNKNNALFMGKAKITTRTEARLSAETSRMMVENNKTLLINPLVRCVYRVSHLGNVDFPEACKRFVRNAGMVKRFTNAEIGYGELESAYNHRTPFEKRVALENEIRRVLSERQKSFGK